MSPVPGLFANNKITPVKGLDGWYYIKDSLKKVNGKITVWVTNDIIRALTKTDCKTGFVEISMVCDYRGCSLYNKIAPYEFSVALNNTFCKNTIIDEILEDSVLIVLIIIAFIIDTINSFLKASLPKGIKTYDEFQLEVPLIFHTYWPYIIFGLVILMSIALLGYGIYSHGFVIGVICRLIPWIMGIIVGKIGYKLLMGA